MHKVSRFIVGSPKCGTSSLYELFKNNPRIGVTKNKETHYFSRLTVADSYYAVEAIDSLSKYQREFSEGKDVYIDICPSYLSCNSAPYEIYGYNSKAEIIIIIRNPIERALSHYLMDYKLGINSSSFMDSLSNPHFKKEYIDEGFYSEFITRYTNLFGEDSVHVYQFEDIVKRNSNELTNLYKLVVSEDECPENLELPKENSFSMPRNQFLSKVRRYISDTRIHKLIPLGIKDVIKKNVFEVNADKPDFSKEKIYLREVYKNEAKVLSEMFPNISLGW
ncbi:sulfotransferase domain-containing protein [Pseudoalteromonas sp. T1lg21]|uniref:sulfotransferase domain-containing protein n=1 Tax=Pseudoalteromonas sp. T1lg21 TaxID=2077095 RepID=UPI000CF6C195|nr:sulfotransferase domain-containing protein [Pseudoalteromonas sp. T1lg21]